MGNSTRARLIGGLLKPGDHLCCFYDSKVEQFEVVLPFLVEGLRNGEKCLYIADENTVAEIKAGLLIHGVDVARALRSGQLTIRVSKHPYRQRREFDPEAVISFFTSAVNEAMKEGYSTLRIAGEMTCMLHQLGSREDFLRYETILDRALRALPVKALCQYNTKMIFGDTLMKVLRTHPRVLLGLDLYENPFHGTFREPPGLQGV